MENAGAQEDAKARYNRIADALLAAVGPVDGDYKYVGLVAPTMGVPLAEVQRILDRLDRIGVVECSLQHPLQCRLTASGRTMLASKARKRTEEA